MICYAQFIVAGTLDWYSTCALSVEHWMNTAREHDESVAGDYWV